jgi:hypothetical protein
MAILTLFNTHQWFAKGFVGKTEMPQANARCDKDRGTDTRTKPLAFSSGHSCYIHVTWALALVMAVSFTRRYMHDRFTYETDI